jgi:uncharacterized phage-like protein YoqJ
LISGMATGFDQALAEAALELNIPLVAAPAFPGMEAKWPTEGADRYFSILKKAVRVHYVCEPPYASFKFIERDKWMVNECDSLLALYNEKEKKSGTGATVRFAVTQNKPVINVWNDWLTYRKNKSGV